MAIQSFQSFAKRFSGISRSINIQMWILHIFSPLCFFFFQMLLKKKAGDVLKTNKQTTTTTTKKHQEQENTE